MSDEELLRKFDEWKKRAGRDKTISALTGRKVSPRQAEILAGIYLAKPRAKTRYALIDILKNEKAS